MSTINKVIIQGVEYGIKDIDATEINNKLRNSIQRVEGRATDSNPMRDPFVWLELPSYEFPTMLAALDNLVTSGAAFGNYFCWLGDQRVMIVHNALSTGGGYIQLVLGTCFSVSNGQLTHSVTNHTAGIFSRVYTGGSYKEWKVGNQDYITAQISALLNGTDPDKIDSLKELVSWVEEHGAEASEMASAIEKNATDIANEVTRAKAEESKLVKKADEAAGVIDIKQTGVTGSDSYTFYQAIPVGTKLRLEWLTPSDVNTQVYASNGKNSYVLASFTNTKRVVEVVTTDVITRVWLWGNYADQPNVVNKYRVVFLDTPIVSVVEDVVELTKGISPNSPSTYSTPMFLGNFTDYAEFLAKLDDMHYNEKTTFKEGKGNCVGWFKAKAGTDYIDIKCVCRYVFGDNWQQVISGFFKLNSAGTLESSTTEYTTLFRNREGSYNSSTGVAVEGTWREWKKITTVQ